MPNKMPNKKKCLIKCLKKFRIKCLIKIHARKIIGKAKSWFFQFRLEEILRTLNLQLVDHNSQKRLLFWNTFCLIFVFNLLPAWIGIFIFFSSFLLLLLSSTAPYDIVVNLSLFTFKLFYAILYISDQR